MKHTRRWAVIASVMVLALFAAACSDVDDSGGSPSTAASGDAAVPDNSDITINLSQSPWVGSAANVTLAKLLLEQKLGYTVKVTEIDEYEQFPALANGDLDATLEVWPSGHAPDYKKYIESGNGVVDAGLLGVDGQIGWWVPTYMLDEHPELATWEGLKGNEDLFKTAESGDAGQLLDGDPSFVTFDQPIADNLGLNLKVIYGGSENAQLTALKTAYAKQDPILMYFWMPHWAQGVYDLTNIELPEVTPECEQAAAEDASKYACAYPADALYKAFNQDLETKAPAAFAFLSAMNYTNDDQDIIALGISKDSKNPEPAAQKWIDENPETWQAWVDAGLAAQSS
jgi:glycine betaine/proline transport system substrate-binding protein